MNHASGARPVPREAGPRGDRRGGGRSRSPCQFAGRARYVTRLSRKYLACRV